MKGIESILLAVKAGDTQAYKAIVEAFQDMAFGCAYALLGDFHLAEDVAQEAFIEAYHNLASLKDPRAFAGWLRRIVQFRCHRLLRGSKKGLVPLDESLAPADRKPGPDRISADRELQHGVLQAIAALSEPLREATTLFYINGYYHRQ
ncbi:RNA polymerase sigma factor, partial [Planctomycetota bacterium]